MTYPEKKKILFISHDSTLTGAPILLINLLRLLKSNNLIEIRIILFRGGILENEFKKYGKVSILKSKNYGKQKFLLLRLVNFLVYRIKLFLLKPIAKKPSFIFSNTITNGKILKNLAAPETKIITYVHELESIIKEYQKEASMSLCYSCLFVCPSQAVAANLVTNYNVPLQKISFLNYYFPVPAANEYRISKEKTDAIFSPFLKFSKNNFYVAAMGSANYRKGIDIFLEAARLSKKNNQDIQFVWIGDFTDDDMKRKIENEVTLNQLSDVFTITGQLPNYAETLLPFNLFILPSREDPYPLVVLEAALLKIPSVCFANTGGIQEFISTDCGWIIDEISAEKLLTTITDIKNHPEELKKRGEHAFTKCIHLHSNAEEINNSFTEVLKKAENLKN